MPVKKREYLPKLLQLGGGQVLSNLTNVVCTALYCTALLLGLTT
jgi:hypothetical protein